MSYRQIEAHVYARLLASALLVGASRHENGAIQDCAQPAAYLADAALGEWKKRYAKTLRNGDEAVRAKLADVQKYCPLAVQDEITELLAPQGRHA